MSGQRKSGANLGRGVMIAMALSGVFLGLTVASNVLVAALVVVPVSFGLGTLLARAVPRATPHSLDHPSFGTAAVVNAPRASGGVSGTGASSAA